MDWFNQKDLLAAALAAAASVDKAFCEHFAGQISRGKTVPPAVSRHLPTPGEPASAPLSNQVDLLFTMEMPDWLSHTDSSDTPVASQPRNASLDSEESLYWGVAIMGAGDAPHGSGHL